MVLMIKIIFPIIFFSILSQAEELTSQTLNDQKWDDITFTQREYTYAHQIREIRRAKNLKKLHSTINESAAFAAKESLFAPYSPWLKDLKGIIDASKNFQQVNYCLGKVSNTNEDSYMWASNFLQHCRRIIGEYLPTYRSKEVDSIKLMDQLEINFNTYLEPENISNIIALFSKIDDSAKEVLAKKLEAYYENSVIAPPKEIREFITINGNLEKIIKDKGESYLEQRKKVLSELKRKLTAVYQNATNTDNPPNYISNESKIIFTFIKNNRAYFADEYLAEKTLQFAHFLTRNNLNADAREYLSYLKTSVDIPEKMINEFHFNFTWSYLASHDYDGAMKYVKTNKLLDKFATLDSQLQFWISYTLFNADKKKESLEFFKSIVTHKPVTYYAIMSMKKIKNISEKEYDSIQKTLFTDKEIKVSLPYTFAKNFKDNLTRLKMWAKINDFYLINHEYNLLKETFVKDAEKLATKSDFKTYTTFFHLSMAKVLTLENSYLNSFRLLYQAADTDELVFNKEILLSLYPMPFNDLIAKYHNSIDPLIISSLIRQESGFDPSARSPVGALGLMQLMPTTAKKIQRNVASKRLFTAETNVQIGSKYLKDLITRFDGNMVFTLAAYNAGERKVAQWKNNYFGHESMLYNIESIPYQETRTYVKLIFRNLYFYKYLQSGDVRDPEDLNAIYDVKLGFKN
jgi:soluble lytic murein transglycosylase